MDEENISFHHKSKSIEDTKQCLKFRYVTAILGSMGMAIIYGLKVNISIALVSMVNHTALVKEAENTDLDHESSTIYHDQEVGPFAWSSKQQGAILSSYFVGYLITQLPGGRLAELYSAKYVFLVATLINAVGALLTPACSFLDYRAVIAIRAIQGLGGGFTFPALNVLVAAWSPPDERSTMSAISFSGTSLGTVISILTSGLLSSTVGWQSVFYIQGGLSLIWCILWLIFVTDTPKSNRFVDAEEKYFIAQSKPKTDGGSMVAPPIPWRSIISSPPFLALAFAHFCNNFGWYMLLIELPLFISSGLGVGMTTNTIISCVPFFANWIFSVGYSRLLDHAKSKGVINTTQARTLSVCVASLIPAACLLGICWSGSNIPAVVSLMMLAVMFYGSMFSGVFSNHSDLAPNFAGTLMAVTNMLATIPGILVPFLVGILTEGKTGLAPWHVVFYMTTGLLALEAVVFLLFGRGELQPWNNPKSRNIPLNRK